MIIWCNGQRLTDLPFERAIEVMRSSAILDLVVQRPAPPNHLYDCPEPLWTRGSSGYDSETSSMVAASPPPQHPNPSSSPQHYQQQHDGRMHQRYPRDDTCNRNGRSVIKARLEWLELNDDLVSSSQKCGKLQIITAFRVPSYF